SVHGAGEFRVYLYLRNGARERRFGLRRPDHASGSGLPAGTFQQRLPLTARTTPKACRALTPKGVLSQSPELYGRRPNYSGFGVERPTPKGLSHLRGSHTPIARAAAGSQLRPVPNRLKAAIPAQIP